VVPIIVNYKTKTLTLGNLVSDLSDVDGIIEAVKAQGLGGHRRAPARL
jgi:hypothetical protein